MFSATYVGHHGWLFQGETARILVDPILTPGWGFTDAVGLTTWPPRQVDLAAFPAIDAVMITHEHEGHFEIPSLHAIDRRVPIYLAARSSLATRAFLGEMGFEVRLLAPEVPVVVGDLEYLPMTANQVKAPVDEWDVLPYLVRDLAGDGSFFSQVDMRVDDSMWQIARERVARPGLWSYTNNHNQWDFLYAWKTLDPRNMARIVDNILAYHQRMSDAWAPPAAVLVAGGGFCFGGAEAWLNDAVFDLASADVAAALSILAPGQRAHWPIPGQTLRMIEGELAAIEPATPYLAALPREQWPTRAGRPPEWLDEYAPATGRRELDADEYEQLAGELDRFAAHLYGGTLFRRLYSLSRAEVGDRRPTFALVLRDGDGAFVYEYQPQACRFVSARVEDPVAEYAAVYECWGTDLLALLRAEVASTALLFARCRHWNACPEVLGFDLDHFLIEYAHPLRHPERFLALYRRILAGLAEPSARIAWAGGGAA